MVLLPLYFSLLIIYIINNFFITENKNNTIIYQLFFYFIFFFSFSFFFGFSIILVRLLFDFIEFIINSLKEKKNLSLPEKLIRIPLKIIQKIQNMVYSIEITSNVS